MKHVQVLGTGCPQCRPLYENTEAALRWAGMEGRIEKVESITEIMKFGAVITPTRVVDGKIKSTGKALSPGQIAALLEEPS